MSTQPEVDGYVWPIHRALTESNLLTGLPRRVAIFLWVGSAAVVLNLAQYWFLGVTVVLHAVGAYLTKKDPDVFTVFWRAIRSQHRLEP